MIYIITLILAVHAAEGTTVQYLFKSFDDEKNCQIAEGDILTSAQNDPDVVGWIMPDECKPIMIPKKV